jgi:catechol 2,3-dioxygenase-like lactoylglutathione lyase family enzyme
VVADRNRGAAYLTLLLGQGGVFALYLFLTYYFQDVLHYSPIKTGVAFLPMMLAVVVVATVTQNMLVQRLTVRVITVTGLIISGAGAALLTQADASSPYAAWVLPGLILVGTGIGSAIVSAVAAGQQGVDPRDAGTAGAVNNVAQQLGAALGVAVISTFVATATSHYLTDHGNTTVVGATVHGFTVGYWWAAGLFWSAAAICGALIRQPTQLFFSRATDPGGRQTHLALRVEDEATVQRGYEFAAARGAEILHEPRLWPEYGPDYYAVFIRDPAGNNLELKCQASTTKEHRS